MCGGGGNEGLRTEVLLNRIVSDDISDRSYYCLPIVAGYMSCISQVDTIAAK